MDSETFVWEDEGFEVDFGQAYRFEPEYSEEEFLQRMQSLSCSYPRSPVLRLFPKLLLSQRLQALGGVPVERLDRCLQKKRVCAALNGTYWLQRGWRTQTSPWTKQRSRRLVTDRDVRDLLRRPVMETFFYLPKPNWKKRPRPEGLNGQLSDHTFVCPTEITAFSDRMEDFKAINTEIVACSADSQFAHMAWISTPRKQGGLGPVQFPLLSDITHQISKDYGVYSGERGHALRGLFIIDGKGVLRQITINDPPVGRSVEETLRLIQAFQYTDAHGEVCPAGWKPGSETIKPEEALRERWPKQEL